MARVNWTQILIQGREPGQVVKAGHDKIVTHDPRSRFDPQPWTDGTLRYGGRECWLEDLGDTCADAKGNEYPEHLEGDIECRRCGAELEPVEEDY